MSLRTFQSWRVPDEVRAQIAAADPRLGSSVLGRLFGVHKTTVLNIRREAGVKLLPRGGPRIWGRQFHARGDSRILRHWPLRPTQPKPLAWAMEAVVA